MNINLIKLRINKKNQCSKSTRREGLDVSKWEMINKKNKIYIYNNVNNVNIV